MKGAVYACTEHNKDEFSLRHLAVAKSFAHPEASLPDTAAAAPETIWDKIQRKKNIKDYKDKQKKRRVDQ